MPAFGAAASAAPWLFVTDIHLKTGYAQSAPSRYGDDTDIQLFDTAIREMRAVDPDPPVVVVTGDLLGHIIDRKLTTATTEFIAQRLNRAFPRAQFLLAFGNDDGACGDYGMTPDGPFLRRAAAAWGPLINRNGAAPDFMRTFVHDGFYTASLPVPGLRAIMLNDVFWSPRYHSGCGPAPNAGARALGELDGALQNAPGRVWVLFHIPPGIDAFSTANLTHRLAIVPFLDPVWRDQFLHLLDRKPGQVALAVAGHTHKFAYRIVDADGPHPVPMLLVPAISPIFGDAPAFLTADVDRTGTLHNVQATSYIYRHWRRIGGMPSLGVDAFTGPQLVALQGRLDRDPELRATFSRLYNAGGPPEISNRTWPVYWCAATAFTTAAFRACSDAGGISFFTARFVKLAAIALAIVALPVGGFVWWRVQRRRLRT